jgi:hypothetical protein
MFLSGFNRWSERIVAIVTTIGLGMPLIAALGTTDGQNVRWLWWTSPIQCAFRARYGYPCGSCGLTRAWILTAHGRLAAALLLHAHGPSTFFATLLSGLVGTGTLLVWRAGWLSRWTGLALVFCSLAAVAASFAPVAATNLALQRAVVYEQPAVAVGL